MKSSPATKPFRCSSKEHNLVLNEEHVKAERQHDLDDKGIAKNGA